MRAVSPLASRPSLQRACAAGVMILGLSSCAFVELTEAGKQVALVTPERAADCKKVGTINSKVLARFVGFDRSATRVARELADLARNEAAQYGGDTIVPTSPIEDGRQTFDLYRCQS